MQGLYITYRRGYPHSPALRLKLALMIKRTAVSELLLLDPRALYRGGLARWIPPWQYLLRGPMHEGVQMVDAKDDAIMEVGVCQYC